MSHSGKVKIEEDSKLSIVSSSNHKPTKENNNKVSKPETNHKKKSTGHRPVTSCTHCRQHKIKCNALETLPKPCARCLKMKLVCEVNPEFKPQKGSQLTILKNDINDLKLKLNYLVRNEGIIANCLKLSKEGEKLMTDINQVKYETISNTCVDSVLTPASNVAQNSHHKELNINSKFDDLPPLLQKTISASSNYLVKENILDNNNTPNLTSPNDNIKSNTGSSTFNALISKLQTATVSPSTSSTSSNGSKSFSIGDIVLSCVQAEQLYSNFKMKYLSFFPILKPVATVRELHRQSPILFWTIMLTSSLSSPTPTLYIELSELIKIKIMQKCWIDTPRSAYIIQALLILCCWPLPSQKIMDDCSYRFLGFAKNLSMQLGLHRGAFMWEFSRTQTMLNKNDDETNNDRDNNNNNNNNNLNGGGVSSGEYNNNIKKQNDHEKWRSRAWIGIFMQEQIWGGILGLPSGVGADFLVNNALNEDDDEDEEDALPIRMKNLLLLTNFQNIIQQKLAMNVHSQDGLLKADERYREIDVLMKDLNLLNEKRGFEKDSIIEIYYLYVKMTLIFYYFLPSSDEKDLSLNENLLKEKVDEAYLAGVKIVTLTTKLLQDNNYQLLELPIYVRNCITYASLMLFKLYLTPLLKDEHVTSCRQSIVTVHRLFRNQYFAWTSVVENDISRLGNVLERLNFVLITHPEIFIERNIDKSTCYGLITKMRSHLSGTLFYDLVWCVHEARRRENDPVWKKNNQTANVNKELFEKKNKKKLTPLPFYNQISKDDFETVTTITEEGITVTTLVPTKQAIERAKKEFNSINVIQQQKKKQILKQYNVYNDEDAESEVEGEVEVGEEDTNSFDKRNGISSNDTKLQNADKVNIGASSQPIQLKRLFSDKQPQLKPMIKNMSSNSIKNFDGRSNLRNDDGKYDNLLSEITNDNSNDMLTINGIPLSMLNETGGLSTKETSATDLFDFKNRNNDSQTSLFRSFAQPLVNNKSTVSLSFMTERAVSNSDVRSNSNINNNNHTTTNNNTNNNNNGNSIAPGFQSPSTPMLNIAKYMSNSPVNTEHNSMMNLSVPPPSAAGGIGYTNRLDTHNLRSNSNISIPIASPRSASNVLPSLRTVIGDINNQQTQQKKTQQNQQNKNDLDVFLLQQSNDWIMDNTNNNADDILGWFDSNMNNEF